MFVGNKGNLILNNLNYFFRIKYSELGESSLIFAKYLQAKNKLAFILCVTDICQSST